MAQLALKQVAGGKMHSDRTLQMSLTANCLCRQRHLPHLVLDTLVEPAAQHGGGVSPPQQDSLSDIEEDLDGRLVTPPSVIFGALASRIPL